MSQNVRCCLLGGHSSRARERVVRWGAAVFALGSGKPSAIGWLLTQEKAETEWSDILGKGIHAEESDCEGREAGGAGGSVLGRCATHAGQEEAWRALRAPFGAWTPPEWDAPWRVLGSEWRRTLYSTKDSSGCRGLWVCCCGPGDGWLRGGPRWRRRPAGSVLIGGGAACEWWGRRGLLYVPLCHSQALRAGGLDGQQMSLR